MKLYHGSINIIKKPKFGEGKPYNDYGLGFYMTKDIELAKEWSASQDTDISYVNEYNIEEKNLKVLNLDNVEDKELKWIALLVYNRSFSLKYQNQQETKKFLLENYLIDVNKYDMIRGYRADDCYFMFAKSFLLNEISIGQLSKSLRLGKLGEQFVLKSKKAFEKIRFIKSYEVDSKDYYIKRIIRNQKASEEYSKVLDETSEKDIYIRDIMRTVKNEKKLY